jgi:hypothetical protein
MKLERMKLKAKQLVISSLLVFPCMVGGQDPHFDPDHQQIPVPECLSMKAAWEGGWKACTQQDHDAGLDDIRHCRRRKCLRA